MPQHGVNSEQIRGKISEHIAQHIHRLLQGLIGPCMVKFAVLSRFPLSEETRQHYKRALPHMDVRSSERCTTDLCGRTSDGEKKQDGWLDSCREEPAEEKEPCCSLFSMDHTNK
jgi:hypothetical protein